MMIIIRSNKVQFLGLQIIKTQYLFKTQQLTYVQHHENSFAMGQT